MQTRDTITQATIYLEGGGVAVQVRREYVNDDGSVESSRALTGLDAVTDKTILQAATAFVTALRDTLASRDKTDPGALSVVNAVAVVEAREAAAAEAVKMTQDVPDRAVTGSLTHKDS